VKDRETKQTMDWWEILELHVCPIAGCVVTLIMFCAPFRDVQSALLQQTPHEKSSITIITSTLPNPIPWAVAVGNTLGWLYYGYLLHDIYILYANLPGLVLNVWYCSSAAKVQYYYTQQRNAVTSYDTSRWTTTILNAQGVRFTDNQNTMSSSLTERNSVVEAVLQQVQDMRLLLTPIEQVLWGIVTAWIVLIVYCGWYATPQAQVQEQQQQLRILRIVGIAVNVNLVFFYLVRVTLEFESTYSVCLCWTSLYLFLVTHSICPTHSTHTHTLPQLPNRLR
jgi:hypothetical protein